MYLLSESILTASLAKCLPGWLWLVEGKKNRFFFLYRKMTIGAAFLQCWHSALQDHSALTAKRGTLNQSTFLCENPFYWLCLYEMLRVLLNLHLHINSLSLHFWTTHGCYAHLVWGRALLCGRHGPAALESSWWRSCFREKEACPNPFLAKRKWSWARRALSDLAGEKVQLQ